MTCRKILEDFLDDYLAGNLPTPQTLIFKSHLALCKDCRNYLDSYQRTIHLAKSALQNTPPNSSADSAPQPSLLQMPEELIQAILKAQRET